MTPLLRRWLAAALTTLAVLAAQPGAAQDVPQTIGEALGTDAAPAETAPEAGDAETAPDTAGDGGATGDAEPDGDAAAATPRSGTQIPPPAGPDLRGVNFDFWEAVARRAEAALARPDVPEATLADLRAEIAAFRDRFSQVETQNSGQIATLQAQIESLGPVPEEGTEPEAIAERRARLNEELATARAPVLAAQEAFTRANGLIGQIDQTLRNRQTEQLLSQGPSPLDPLLWREALQAMVGSARLLLSEFDDEITQADATNLPLTIVLALCGMVLLLRGPATAEKSVEWLRRRTRRGSGVWQFMLSLGMVVLPVMGILLISWALQISALVGERSEFLLARVPFWIGIFLYIRWLARQTFSREDDIATMPIEMGRRVEAWTYFNVLAGIIILKSLQQGMVQLDDYGPGTRAVLDFPLTVAASLLLFRLGLIFQSARLAVDSDDSNVDAPDAMHFRMRLARILGRLLLLAAILAPVLALTGYRTISTAIIYPSILTLVLAGTVLVLMRFVGDLHALITGRSPQDTQSLIPVFAGFVLILAALPLLALIWGARVTDLTEIWQAFVTGFAIGETRISPVDFLMFLLVFMVGYGLTKIFQNALRSTVLPRTRIDVGGQNALVSGLGYIGVFVAAIVAFTTAGIDLSSLAIVAGALSVGIGFGLQTIVQNFVSGIILLIERPISQGDWIQVGTFSGFVKDISVRSTRIETFDRSDVIVPNADLISNTVTNYTHGNAIGRLIVPISVAYGSDTRKVDQILMSIARAHPLVMMNPEPFIYFRGFDDNALQFEIRVILTDVVEILTVQTEMNHQIAERFAEAGIEIPFPQRDLWIRNAEELTGRGEASHRAFAGKHQDTRRMPPERPAHNPNAMDMPDGE